MAYTSESFIATIKPYAIEDMKKNNILASLTVAQAFIESNKGNSGLTQVANNLFGIKGKYNGHSVTMLTTEYVNSQPVKVYADFRKYPSWQESIYDHSAFLRKYKRYASIIGETDYKLACQKMGKSGYATSPAYGNTLLSTVEKYKLYEIDNEVLGKRLDTKKTDEIPIELYPTIKFGDESLWTVLAQQKLVEQGYLQKRDIDGKFGIKTKQAVISFQGMNELTKDGIIGKKTWYKLCK